MKTRNIVLAGLLVVIFMVSGCAFFGNINDEDDWYGAMDTGTFERYSEHQLFMNVQELALMEREIALKERNQHIGMTNKQHREIGRNQYQGFLKNTVFEMRTAQIIEAIRLSQTKFREIGVVHSVKLDGTGERLEEKRKRIVAMRVSLPEGYYLVKWYDGERIVQEDKIMAKPHRTVQITEHPTETFHYSSYCRR